MCVTSDASSLGGRAFCLKDWFYTYWDVDYPALSKEHINTKELASVLLAAHRWAKQWSGHQVLVYSDNTATVAAINNQSTLNPISLNLLKHLSALAIHYDFSMTAQHLPGHKNVIADSISRLHEAGMLHKLFTLLRPTSAIYQLKLHMSNSVFEFLTPQIIQWINYVLSSMPRSSTGELVSSPKQLK